MVVFDMQTNNAGDRHRAVCRRCGWKSPWLERQVWAKRRFEKHARGCYRGTFWWQRWFS